MGCFVKLLPILLSILTVAIMTTLVVGASTKHRSGFGDSCSDTVKCKSQSWLVCNPETSQCGCAKPDEMVYDSEREKCVVIIGERCKYGFAFDDDSLGSFYETVNCVNNAQCDRNDGICTCPIGTYELVEESKCAPVKRQGAECQSSVECNHTLACLNGKCECASDKMVVETSSGKCKIKAGESCRFEVDKDLNASCVNRSECIDGVCECMTGMYMESGTCLPVKGIKSDCNSDYECDNSQKLTCINDKCECQTGYKQNSEGLCRLAYDQTCSQEDLCSDGLVCTQYSIAIVSNINVMSTKCLCPNADLQFYKDNVCKGFVGGPCTTETGCTENAHCVNKQRDRYRSDDICECKDGFVENDLMNCDIAHGFECEPYHGIPCDRRAELLCKKRSLESKFHCRCPNDDDVFNSETRRCQRRSYYTCKRDSDCRSGECILKSSSDSIGRCD